MFRQSFKEVVHEYWKLISVMAIYTESHPLRHGQIQQGNGASQQSRQNHPAKGSAENEDSAQKTSKEYWVSNNDYGQVKEVCCKLEAANERTGWRLYAGRSRWRGQCNTRAGFGTSEHSTWNWWRSPRNGYQLSGNGYLSLDQQLIHQGCP